MHAHNAPIRDLTLGGLVSVTLIGETYLHKTSNSRLCPLQSCDEVNLVMRGVAQLVKGLHCKTII
jgi:hypothetical protein